MSELKPCPFCGGEVSWCDSRPDDDGDKHECDNIICLTCKLSITPTCQESYEADCFEEMKNISISKWNTRAPQSEWISVDDDLPDSDDEFLVVSHGETRTCMFNPWRSDPQKNREYSYM